jgi:hypothetical protein
MTGNGGPLAADSRAAIPKTNPRRDAIWIGVIVVTAAAIVVASAGIIPAWLASVHPRTSDFAPVEVRRVAEGSIGCQPMPGEVCYLAAFSSSIQGLTLSHLHFAVANSSSSTTSGPEAPLLRLGISASVSVLGSPDSMAGVWNDSRAQWVSGSTWNVPTSVNTTVILDTGWISHSTLENAEFYVILMSPFVGAIGFPLYCGEC